MPGPQYPQNPTFKPMVDAAYKLGSMLPPKKSAKAIDVNQYSGVSDAVKQGASTPPQGLGTVTTPYGGKTHYESYHPGIDYVTGGIGSPVPFRGKVGGTVVGVQGGQKQGSSGFGNYVMVKDQLGNTWRFSHLNNSYVKVGQQIQPGTVLGGEGNTGQTYSESSGSGAHVDMRIKDAYGKYVDPYSLIS